MDDTAHGGESLGELFQQFRNGGPGWRGGVVSGRPDFCEVEALERLVDRPASSVIARVGERLLQSRVV